MRAAETVKDRRLLLKKELLILSTLILVGSLVLAWLTPLLVTIIYQDKFFIQGKLIVAAIAMGALKAYSGLAKAAVLALCTTDELASLGHIIWLSTGAATAGAIIGAKWGLAGLVLGIGIGWLVLLLVYGFLIARHLRDDVAKST
jgi:hypothetical protein